jgi:hypothetical protein
MATNWYIYVHNANNYLGMWKFFAEHAHAFWQAVYGTTVVWSLALFIIDPHVPHLLLAVLKIAYAIMLGFATAFGKVLFDYFHANYKRKRQLKRKNDGEQKGRAA